MQNTPIHAEREKYFPPFWARCAKSERTPPIAYGDRFPFLSLRDIFPRPGEVVLGDGAFGMAGKFPAKAQSARARQRLPPRGSWQSRQALTEGVPSRENGTAERPQTLRCSEIINDPSADNGQSGAEVISDCPALGGVYHKIRRLRNVVLGKIALLQRHPPGGKIRVAGALPRL